MIAQPDQQKHCCRKAFLIALLTAAIIFLPFVIWDKGYFFFFGDFNVQQIPFYKLAHEAIRNGDFFWNWYTDLGANFIGSYSFYLIGSPFFWLTLPFPTEFVPHLMAPLLVLKHACAALTGALYIKRFVRHGDYAVMGGLLYAFSGFAVYNIFFNHFHEAIVFFPLLLVGIEELVTHNRRGVFALAVAVNAFVNYWFFIGEVVFVILYFIIRSLSPDWRMSFKKFFRIAFESVVGVLLSAVLLLPSVLAITGNPRTGFDSLLSGWNFWVYWHNQLQPAIVSSAFFPPDLPSRPNLFPDRGAKWASLSAWLPFFSMTGVIAYIQSKRDWLRRILLVSFLFALVPGLNSLFVLFNNSYYARWYYMPLLLMAMASVLALECHSVDLPRGFKWTAVYTAAVTVILGLTPTIQSDGKMKFGLTRYPERFAAIAAIALLGLAAFLLLYNRYKGTVKFARVMTVGLCFVVVTYSVTFIAMGKSHSDDTDFIRDVALDGRYELEIPNEPGVFARSDLFNSMDNLGMYWHLPNIQAFHSIIPVSTMEFYPEVGVKRDVSSKPETKYYQLRSLLSVRWFFVKEDEAEQEPMPGWDYVSNQLGYNLYENRYFVPMGFTYDGYITRSEFNRLEEEDRAAVLLRALVIEDDAEKPDDILRHLEREDYDNLDTMAFYDDAEARRDSAGSAFAIDGGGFTSEIGLPAENLVFFSVPYDKGWEATVNGRPAQIERVSIGFMAVRAPAGSNVIRFTYTTPGLYAGIVISTGALALLIAYLLLWKKFGKPDPPPEPYTRGFDELEDPEDGEPRAEWLEDPGTPPEDAAPPAGWFEESPESKEDDK